MIQYPLYIKSLLVVCFFVVYGTRVQAQKPKNGIYTYKIAFAEWNGRALGSSCIVRIKRDSVILINNGTLSGEKGDIIDKGIIVRRMNFMSMFLFNATTTETRFWLTILAALRRQGSLGYCSLAFALLLNSDLSLKNNAHALLTQNWFVL